MKSLTLAAATLALLAVPVHAETTTLECTVTAGAPVYLGGDTDGIGGCSLGYGPYGTGHFSGPEGCQGHAAPDNNGQNAYYWATCETGIVNAVVTLTFHY